jgi:diaminohydroxyphosphoribosylaminopyrimidine deaminase / 5-amino-6-(5-phosphoribosylamino)uracil reductase
LFHSAKAIGRDGIDALERLPLTALTQSPWFRCVTSAPIGTDLLDILERREGHVHRHHQ